jgi:ectoine hydroxylase-related dioxygenase (phytanoyl-CoA dioxygenase family)
MGWTRFADDGVAIIEAVTLSSTLAHLRSLPEFSASGRPGQRSFAVAPTVAGLIGSGSALTQLATGIMGETMRPVRVLYFDKTPGANWAVPWHQDRTIAVARRIDAPGYEAWSVKAGIDHVEPPETILKSIVSLRLHIDDCGHDNGPLLALRGSFRLGRVASSEIKKHVDGGCIEVCCAKAGDVVAMRGLTIHASERVLQPSHRRVIHVDFSSAELPHGLEWALPRPNF